MNKSRSFPVAVYGCFHLAEAAVFLSDLFHESDYVQPGLDFCGFIAETTNLPVSCAGICGIITDARVAWRLR
jgi:hypothetical protein